MSNGTRDTTNTPPTTVSAVKKMTTKESNTNDKKRIIRRKPKEYIFKMVTLKNVHLLVLKTRKLNGKH